MLGLTLAGYIIITLGFYVCIGAVLAAISKHFFKADDELCMAFMVWPITFPILFGFTMFTKLFRIVDSLLYRIRKSKKNKSYKLCKQEDEIITSKNYHKIKSLIAEYEKNLPVMERI